MSTISQIREALAERIAVADDGLRVYKTPPADGIGNDLPCAYPRGLAGNFTTTFGGSTSSFPMDAEWTVRVIVRSEEADEAWMQLEEYLNPEGNRSIAAAINTDPSLGLSDVQCAAIGFRNVGFNEQLPGVLSGELVLRLIRSN